MKAARSTPLDKCSAIEIPQMLSRRELFHLQKAMSLSPETVIMHPLHISVCAFACMYVSVHLFDAFVKDRPLLLLFLDRKNVV